MSLWVNGGGNTCWWGRGGERGGSQGLQQYREFGSGMPAEHRRIGDVTQGKKRQEAAGNCLHPAGQEKVEDCGKHVGKEPQKHRTTMDR